MTEINKKILLIDDDPLIMRMYQNKLASDGYRVFLAFNGEEGFIEAKKEKPDLILLDLVMPKMNGIETLKLIKGDAEIKDIPIIVLTSLEDREEDVVKIKELGASDYINKSKIDLKKLSEIIRSAL